MRDVLRPDQIGLHRLGVAGGRLRGLQGVLVSLDPHSHRMGQRLGRRWSRWRHIPHATRLDAVRCAAIEQTVGTFVESSLVVPNGQLAEDLIHTTVSGVIVEERILRRGVAEAKDEQGAIYETRIKAKVRGVPVERRGTFAVSARLNRVVFNEGDEVEIRITPTEDAYRYICNVAPCEHITVLAPHSYGLETLLHAGNEPVKLRTWLLPGTTRSSDELKVVVTRQPVSLPKGQVAVVVFMEDKPFARAPHRLDEGAAHHGLGRVGRDDPDR